MNYKNFINSPENQKLLMMTHFKTWARFTYGSNVEEQDEEFDVGLLYGLSMSGLKANFEAVEGLNEFIKEKGWEKLPEIKTFLLKAMQSKEYRDALVMMVEQGIDQYKIDYANADPGEKGRMAGDLVGQVLMSGFGAAKTAEGLKDFVKSGKFANALKNMSEAKTKLRSVIKASTSDFSSLITKVYSRENGLIDVEFAGVLQGCHKRIRNS